MIYQLDDKQAENIFMHMPGVLSQVRAIFEEKRDLMTVEVVRKEKAGLLVTVCHIARTAFSDLSSEGRPGL